MFGIRFTADNGEVKYVASSKGKPGMCTDINDIARIVQQQSAVREVNRYRLDGYEKDGMFDVIQLQTIIAGVIDVPQKAKKTGWVISIEALMTTPTGQVPVTRFYSGKAGVEQLDRYTWSQDPNEFRAKAENMERATHFKTRQAADDKLNEMFDIIRERLKASAAAMNSGAYLYDDPTDLQEWLTRLKAAVISQR